MATLEVIEGDITALEVDAIANAANTGLEHGGGVAGAISRAGGPSIQAESDEAGPDRARRGGRHRRRRAALPLGDPRGDHAPRRPNLGRDHRRGDRERPCGSPTSSARARSLWSPSVPASAASRSTEAARIEVEAVRRHLEGETALERIVFCVRGDEARTAFEAALAE